MTKAETPSAKIARRGLMLVLSSPSGAGKSTLSRMLLDEDAAITMSVSVTTRPMRPGEIDGVHYHFIDKAAYERLKAEDGLLESARVFDNYYGTPRAPVEAALEAGRDVLFDIDWQGTQQVHEKARGDLVRVFVLPPSVAELEARLRRRAQDSDEVVKRRMAGASAEISPWAEYDYIIVNDDLATAFSAVKSILAAERLKRDRRTGLSEFVRKLQEGL